MTQLKSFNSRQITISFLATLMISALSPANADAKNGIAGEAADALGAIEKALDIAIKIDGEITKKQCGAAEPMVKDAEALATKSEEIELTIREKSKTFSSEESQTISERAMLLYERVITLNRTVAGLKPFCRANKDAADYHLGKAFPSLVKSLGLLGRLRVH